MEYAGLEVERNKRQFGNCQSVSCRFNIVYQCTLCFKKTGTLFISFIIHSNDDQFTQNFYQM